MRLRHSSPPKSRVECTGNLPIGEKTSNSSLHSVLGAQRSRFLTHSLTHSLSVSLSPSLFPLLFLSRSLRCSSRLTTTSTVPPTLLRASSRMLASLQGTPKRPRPLSRCPNIPNNHASTGSQTRTKQMNAKEHTCMNASILTKSNRASDSSFMALVSRSGSSSSAPSKSASVASSLRDSTRATQTRRRASSTLLPTRFHPFSYLPAPLASMTR